MVIKFVGEVNAVRERQLEFISAVLQEKGFENCEVAIEPVGKVGDNFIANVKRIVVKQDDKQFRMVAKLAPLSRDVLDVTVLFQNEHVIYTTLFPLFRELQRNSGIPEKNWFSHAECYGTFMEKPNEVILLEDLKESNFGILNKHEPLTIEQTKLVLKQFALFHSLSFALKSKDQKKFDEVSTMLKDPYDLPQETTKMRTKLGMKMENDVLEKMSDNVYRDAIVGSISNFVELSVIQKKEKGSKYSVIQQGDGWTNNIMFAFDDEKSPKCVLIDYQISKENSPAYDIMYMIFNSTDADERIKYYTELIVYYYNELDKALSNYELKATDVYPREVLDNDMKRYAKLIVSISIIVINLTVKDVAEASKLKATLEKSTSFSESMTESMMERSANTEVLFKKRIEGLARSVMELGLL